MEQGSPEWHAARLGKVTASRIADVVAKTKTGVSAMRATYMGELLAERLTGNPTPTYQNDAMRWGSENEAGACDAYAWRFDVDLETIGFVDHPTIFMAGASPDRLIAADGLLEVKCPNTATHIETLSGGSIPARYRDQIQWQLAVTERAWCDFASFDPRLPEHLRLYVERIPRDADRIAELEREVRAFLGEIDAKLAALAERTARAA